MWQLCKDENGGDKKLDLVKQLIEKKQVNLNLEDHQVWWRPTAIHYAASRGHTATVEFLLKNGATVDCKTKYGWTQIHEAAKSGHTATVEILLKKGATVNCKDYDGKTPLQLATAQDESKVIDLLKKYGGR